MATLRRSQNPEGLRGNVPQQPAARYVRSKDADGELQETAWPEHARGLTQRLSLIRHVHKRHKGGYKIERPVGKLKCLEEENRRLKQPVTDLSLDKNFLVDPPKYLGFD